MSREELFEKVNEIARDVFDDEELTLTDETTANDVAQWDSLTHMSFISDMEDEFDINFTLGEIRSSKNVGELVDAVMKHLGAKR